MWLCRDTLTSINPVASTGTKAPRVNPATPAAATRRAPGGPAATRLAAVGIPRVAARAAPRRSAHVVSRDSLASQTKQASPTPAIHARQIHFAAGSWRPLRPAVAGGVSLSVLTGLRRGGASAPQSQPSAGSDRRGMWTSMRVPCASRDSILRSPPASAARSRMLTNPRLPRWA